MSTDLAVRNCQRAVRLDPGLFREVTRHLLEQELGLQDYALGIQFVSERRITALNRQFLQHEGSTDVIAFDHREITFPDTDSAFPPAGQPDHPERRTAGRRNSPRGRSSDAGSKTVAPSLHGELFLCPAVARVQAREFRTSMQEELVRYIVHGVLHLRGFDDLTPRDRRPMKHEEARLLRRLARRFTLSRAARGPRVRA